ncbi:MAG: hypothetical protein IJ889_01230 [Eubacterium sp.]|nr:hypothetical protein [Eubacterium sp.]
MKRILAIGLILIMTTLALAACGNEYDFVELGDDKKSLDIELDANKKGYSWKTTIGELDKLVLKKEKVKDGKYIAKIGTIIKSGKGKKGGRASVAFTYVNDKDPNDVYLGYVVGVGINPQGKAEIRSIDEYKVNFETTLKEDD